MPARHGIRRAGAKIIGRHPLKRDALFVERDLTFWA
jgi:hypothetical protein